MKILEGLPEKISTLNNILVLGSSLRIGPVGGDMCRRGGLTLRLLLRWIYCGSCWVLLTQMMMSRHCFCSQEGKTTRRMLLDLVDEIQIQQKNKKKQRGKYCFFGI